MAGLAALLLKPALDAALAGTAAKGTMDMNKEEATKPILDDGLLSKSEKKETKALDVSWLITPVAIVSYPSTLFHTALFPAPGRPGIHISGDFVATFLHDAQERHANPFSDFNFLLFVSTLPMFSSRDDIQGMCDSLVQKRDVNGFIDILMMVAPNLQ